MATKRGEGGAPDALQILLVEDDPEQREPVLEILRGSGYQVSVAEDGSAAVRAAAKSVFDVIVMDVSLPHMDGIEAIRRIRAATVTRNGARPHIIVLSAQVDARTRQLAFEAGCDQYLIKPCGLDAIVGAVAAYFDKRDGTGSPASP